MEESLALGREISERIEGKLGPDHFITLMASARAGVGRCRCHPPQPKVRSVAARSTGRRKLLGPDHPITLIAATAVVTGATDDDDSARETWHRTPSPESARSWGPSIRWPVSLRRSPSSRSQNSALPPPQFRPLRSLLSGHARELLRIIVVSTRCPSASAPAHRMSRAASSADRASVSGALDLAPSFALSPLRISSVFSHPCPCPLTTAWFRILPQLRVEVRRGTSWSRCPGWLHPNRSILPRMRFLDLRRANVLLRSTASLGWS